MKHKFSLSPPQSQQTTSSSSSSYLLQSEKQVRRANMMEMGSTSLLSSKTVTLRGTHTQAKRVGTAAHTQGQAARLASKGVDGSNRAFGSDLTNSNASRSSGLGPNQGGKKQQPKAAKPSRGVERKGELSTPQAQQSANQGPSLRPHRQPRVREKIELDAEIEAFPCAVDPPPSLDLPLDLDFNDAFLSSLSSLPDLLPAPIPDVAFPSEFLAGSLLFHSFFCFASLFLFAVFHSNGWMRFRWRRRASCPSVGLSVATGWRCFSLCGCGHGRLRSGCLVVDVLSVRPSAFSLFTLRSVMNIFL